MATMTEQMTEEHLRNVFSEIKGPQGKNRAFINFSDFEKACLKYKPACLKQIIQESEESGNRDELIAHFEEHFRNICECVSPTVENVATSPKFGGDNGETKPTDEDDLLGDLGNTSIDEGERAALPQKKKLKKRPTPHYLTATAASKAMQ